jgi:hypothetical protein
MAGRRLAFLKMERNDLIDRFVGNKESDRVKILVRIMDLDEDIDKVLKEEQAPTYKRRRYYN